MKTQSSLSRVTMTDLSPLGMLRDCRGPFQDLALKLSSIVVTCPTKKGWRSFLQLLRSFCKKFLVVQRSKVCKEQVEVYIETNKEQVKEVSVEGFFFFFLFFIIGILTENILAKCFGRSEKQHSSNLKSAPRFISPFYFYLKQIGG